MSSAQDLAKAVEKRAKELLPESIPEPLEPEFIKQCLDANERGDGVMFSSKFKGKYLQNVTPKDDEWYSWTGNVWEPDDFKSSVNTVEECTLEYERMAKPLKIAIDTQDIDKKHPDAWKLEMYKKYNARVARMRSKAGANAALYWAPIVDPSMACKEHDFNQHPWILPVKNGVIDLQTGAMTQGRPEDLMTKALDIEYDTQADYSLWHDTVVDICGSEDMASFIKRVFGYAITGHAFEQKFFVFIGPGRNGKGVLFSLLGKIMGSFYHEISKAMILRQRTPPSPNAATEHLYSLMSKRIVVGAETNRGEKIDESSIKGLTGEDRITTRPLFKSELNFLPTHTLFLHTNHPPYGLTSDFAMRQRMILVEFPNMYVDDVELERKKYPIWADRFRQKNPQLKAELEKTQLPGILRWLVEGCLEWQERGLDPPKSVTTALDNLSQEEDYMGQYIGDCLEMLPDEKTTRITCKGMYRSFEWWWSENMDAREQRIPAMKTVNKMLRERGFKIDKAGGKTYVYMVKLKYDIVNDVEEFFSARASKS